MSLYARPMINPTTLITLTIIITTLITIKIIITTLITLKIITTTLITLITLMTLKTVITLAISFVPCSIYQSPVAISFFIHSELM
jgi:hypothetical protein